MWPAGQPFFRLVPRFFHALMPRKGTCVPLAPPFFARRRPGGTQTARSASSPAPANASAFALASPQKEGREERRQHGQPLPRPLQMPPHLPGLTKVQKAKTRNRWSVFLMKTGDNVIIKINLYKWDCGPGIEIPCQGRFSQYLQFTILFPFLVLLLTWL